jgi:hypothetical protein
MVGRGQARRGAARQGKAWVLGLTGGRSMFKKTRPDGRSYREVLVDALKEAEYNTVYTYQQLGTMTALDRRDRIQMTVRLANKALLKLYHRGLRNVANVGYRIINPNEHMAAGQYHQTKSNRQLAACVRFYEGTALEKLTENERKLHLGQQMLAEALLASHRHLDRRLKRVEDLLSGTPPTI